MRNMLRLSLLLAAIMIVQSNRSSLGKLSIEELCYLPTVISQYRRAVCHPPIWVWTVRKWKCRQGLTCVQGFSTRKECQSNCIDMETESTESTEPTEPAEPTVFTIPETEPTTPATEQLPPETDEPNYSGVRTRRTRTPPTLASLAP